MDSSEFFYRLTPDRVLDAVERLGMSPSGHHLALNSLENRVFSIALDDRSHVVVKFYRPGRWTRAQIAEEHAFLADLAEAEIPVVVPLAFAGETVHETEGILYTVWPRCGGRVPDELDVEQLGTLGRLLGRIHQVGAARPARHRVAFGAESHLENPLAFLLAHAQLPGHCVDRFTAAVRRVAALYRQLSAPLPVQRIHGDCHIGNLLLGDAGFFFLDFDDCMSGPVVQDFWMLWPEKGAAGQRPREAFLEGYATFHAVTAGWQSLPEILRAMRFVHYAAWIARRWPDPAFPAAFPHFGTAGFWEQETRDLEDQLLLIEETLAPAGTAPPAPEVLTNKDFFWDLDD